MENGIYYVTVKQGIEVILDKPPENNPVVPIDLETQMKLHLGHNKLQLL